MIVLRANIEYFRMIGLMLAPNEKSNIMKNILVTVPIFMVLIETSAYLLSNITEIVKMTYALYVLSSEMIHFVTYFTYTFRKRHFQLILDELRAIVTTSAFCRITFRYLKFNSNVLILPICDKGMQRSINGIFEATEKKTETFMIYFRTIIMTITSSCFFMPFAVAIYCYATGGYTNDVWFYPIPVV